MRRRLLVRIGAVVFSLAIVTVYVGYRAAGRSTPAPVPGVGAPEAELDDSKTVMPGSKSGPAFPAPHRREVMSGSKSGGFASPEDFPPEPKDDPEKPGPAAPSQPAPANGPSGG